MTTPTPSPRDLDALAPLVESAYSDLPAGAFRVIDPSGKDVLAIRLEEYDRMQTVAENWIRQAQEESQTARRWCKRAIRAEKFAGFFGLILMIIAAGQVLRWWFA